MVSLRFLRERLVTKSLSCLQQEPDNQKHINTFCRRFGNVENVSLDKKIQLIQVLFASHGVDAQKALPLVGNYYAREVVLLVAGELEKIKKEQRTSTLFTNFSDITQESLQRRAETVTSLYHFTVKSFKDRCLYQIGWKKIDTTPFLRKEQLIKQMRLALEANGLEEVIASERERIAKRSPEKKAALVAEMLLSEKTRMSRLENQLQLIHQEVANQEMGGILYMVPYLKKQQKKLEATLSVAKDFCEKAAEAVVAEYNAKERDHLQQLMQIEQFILSKYTENG